MRTITRDLAWIEPALFLAVALLLSGTASTAQISDITQPPPILHAAGQFSARPLSQPPVIDGRAWSAAEFQPTYSSGTVPLKTGTFSLTVEDCGDHGDFTRCQLLFHRKGDAPVRIHPGFTAWVFVTPDARYIITEPLYVLDVRNWKQYALSEALNIPNYTAIKAISRDGKRLVISRKDCGMDCPQAREEYYELTMP